MKATTPTIDEKKQQLIIPGTQTVGVELAWGMADPQMILDRPPGRIWVLQEKRQPVELHVYHRRDVTPFIGIPHPQVESDDGRSIWRRIWDCLCIGPSGWPRTVVSVYLLEVVRFPNGEIHGWRPIKGLLRKRAYELRGAHWGGEPL